MVRVLLVLRGASLPRLLRAAPGLARRFPFHGPLRSAASPPAGACLAPVAGSPGERAAGVRRRHGRFIASVARRANADLLGEVVRIDVPLVAELRARGVRRARAHAEAALLLRSLVRVIGPEVAVVACTGEPPSLLDRLRGPDGSGAGWRSEIPVPAWSEADLWRCLAGTRLPTPR